MVNTLFTVIEDEWIHHHEPFRIVYAPAIIYARKGLENATLTFGRFISGREGGLGSEQPKMLTIACSLANE